LIDQLFRSGAEKNEKRPLEEIREKIAHFDQAHYEILTLSEDEVSFKIFKVAAKKLKNELGEQALKCKEKILEATYQYCNDQTSDVRKQYSHMIEKINHDPQNERELIDTKDFIAKSTSEVERLQQVLKQI